MQSSFVAVVIAVVSFLLSSGFKYAHVRLILIKQCLSDVAFSNTKAKFSQATFLLSPSFSAIWKTMLL